MPEDTGAPTGETVLFDLTQTFRAVGTIVPTAPVAAFAGEGTDYFQSGCEANPVTFTYTLQLTRSSD